MRIAVGTPQSSAPVLPAALVLGIFAWTEADRAAIRVWADKNVEHRTLMDLREVTYDELPADIRELNDAVGGKIIGVYDASRGVRWNVEHDDRPQA